MGGFSIWHLLIFFVIELLWVVPMGRLFRRIGYSRWWAAFAFIPLVSIVLLWIVAFSPWRIADWGEEPLVGERS